MRPKVNVEFVSRDCEIASMNDDVITKRSRDLLVRSGLSMSALAKVMGYRGPSSIQRYFSEGDFKAEYLPHEFVKKLVPALSGRGNPPITNNEVLELAGPFYQQLAIGKTSQPYEAVPLEKTTATLSVYGLAIGGEEGYLIMNGSAIDKVPCPPILANVPGAYAIFVSGDSMEPRYYAGEVVYVHPTKPPIRGRFVVVQIKPERDGEPPLALVKQFVSWGSRELVLHQFNPDQEVRIPAIRVLSVHRVVNPWGEL